jgi:hypothetical protein
VTSSRGRFVLTLVLAVGVAGCGGNQIPPAQNYGTIGGRAYDSASNQPVAGVVVTVDTILTATTGVDGSYKIVNVPLGQYTLQPSAPQGYSADPQSGYDGSISAGQVISIDIPLTKQ